MGVGIHMGHEHGHDHTHSHTTNKKLLKIAFILITAFMVVEVIGGLITNSLALLSDAGHMLSDSIALLLSLLAFWFSEKPSNSKNSYGYKRAEIIAALLNGLTLIAIAIYIFYEGIKRVFQPPEVLSIGMFWIATLGLVVNIIAAWILMKGDKENLNLRSAFLHVIGDLLGSVGAIIAAILIWGFNFQLADPIASMLVAVLVLISGIRVTKSSIHILMEGVPANINLDKIRKNILQIPGILNIHDLHVWSITSGFPALSCHIVLDNKEYNKGDEIISAIRGLIKDKYSINHSTIQLEKDYVCESGDNCGG